MVHKKALKSDRASCHKATANQFWLFLHSAAYMLMHALRDKLPDRTQLAHAQFDTIRMRLLRSVARVKVFTPHTISFAVAFPVQGHLPTPLLSFCRITDNNRQIAVPAALKIAGIRGVCQNSVVCPLSDKIFKKHGHRKSSGSAIMGENSPPNRFMNYSG